MAIVGVVLIVVGIGFLFLGFAGAVKAMFNKAAAEATRGAIADITKLIDAVTGIIKALTAAPQWLACVIIGIALVGAGAYLLGAR